MPILLIVNIKKYGYNLAEGLEMPKNIATLWGGIRNAKKYSHTIGEGLEMP